MFNKYEKRLTAFRKLYNVHVTKGEIIININVTSESEILQCYVTWTDWAGGTPGYFPVGRDL